MHCIDRPPRSNVPIMIDRRLIVSHTFPVFCGLILCVTAPSCVAQGPPSASVAAYNSYVRAVESRLVAQHRRSADFFVIAAPVRQNQLRLHRGELIVEQLTPSTGLALSGALLHHWRATAFVPGATAAGFFHIMQDFRAYPRAFVPQVLHANVLTHHDNHFMVCMRVRQHHIITVVLDTTYDVSFGQLDPLHRYSISRSTQITEVDTSSAAREHAFRPGEDHGFLWRQNTYWTCEQRDGGLYIQVESISLTRSIPWGMGWAVSPLVESVPRESLEFTLRSVVSALRQ
jgi:hypothetical protein